MESLIQDASFGHSQTVVYSQIFVLYLRQNPSTKTWENFSCAVPNFEIVLGRTGVKVATKDKKTSLLNTQSNMTQQFSSGCEADTVYCARVWVVRMLLPASFRGRRPEWDERWPPAPHPHQLAGPLTSSLRPSSSRSSCWDSRWKDELIEEWKN